ncbi:hypothetical protein B484DRAFT_225939 [Ochromonadaceae sp. CCMP2298]|nr:hypothetical protein B484DRAFT_225939 [Ochromonadaceae sp. CCMP2298]
MSLVRVARLLLSAACAWALVGAFVQQASVPRTVLFAKGKVGGIYEFAGAARGNQPPAELAEMLGLRVKKPSRKPAKKSPPSAKTPASEGPAGEVKRGRGRPRKDAEPVLSVDDLEKQVLAKYGSNSFKQGVEEDWDDEELEELNLLTKGDKVVRGKFQGFQPSTKLQTEVPKEKGEKGAKAKVIVAEEDEEEEEGQAAKRTSLSERLRLRKSQGTSPTTGLGSARTPSSTPTSSTSSTPTSSGLEGYELDFESERADEGEDYGWDEEDLQYLFGGKGKKTRKMKEEAAAREKEAIREARVRASREAAKSQFVPFNFSDAKYEEGARVEEEEGLELQLMSGLRAARDGESEGWALRIPQCLRTCARCGSIPPRGYRPWRCRRCWGAPTWCCRRRRARVRRWPFCCPCWRPWIPPRSRLVESWVKLYIVYCVCERCVSVGPNDCYTRSAQKHSVDG